MSLWCHGTWSEMVIAPSWFPQAGGELLLPHTVVTSSVVESVIEDEAAWVACGTIGRDLGIDIDGLTSLVLVTSVERWRVVSGLRGWHYQASSV